MGEEMKCLMVKAYIRTNGQGLWTKKVGRVWCTYLELAYLNKEKTFGELRVHFSPKTWNTKEDGLIYTDPEFEAGMKRWLEEWYDFPTDIQYSEAGMQGATYVSFDTGPLLTKVLCEKLK